MQSKMCKVNNVTYIFYINYNVGCLTRLFLIIPGISKEKVISSEIMMTLLDLHSSDTNGLQKMSRQLSLWFSRVSKKTSSCISGEIGLTNGKHSHIHYIILVSLVGLRQRSGSKDILCSFSQEKVSMTIHENIFCF